MDKSAGIEEDGVLKIPNPLKGALKVRNNLKGVQKIYLITFYEMNSFGTMRLWLCHSLVRLVLYSAKNLNVKITSTWLIQCVLISLPLGRFGGFRVHNKQSDKM